MRFVLHNAAIAILAFLGGVPVGALALEPTLQCRVPTHAAVSGLIAGSANTVLALRDDGRPVIAYIDPVPSRQLKLLLCDDAECSAGTTRLIENDVETSSVDLDLVLDANGAARVSYYDRLGAPGARIYVCSDPACSSGAIRPLTNQLDFGITTSISMSPGNRPFVAFCDRRATTDDLVVCRCADAICSAAQCRTVHDDPRAGLYPDTLWRNDGTALIAHVGYSGAETYQCADADCANGSNHHVDDPPQGAAYAAITARPDGRPLMAYGAFSGTTSPQPGVVKLVDCADRNCSSATSRVLDTTQRQVRIVRMTTRQNGRAVITYGETGGANALYFHQCADRNCANGRNGVVTAASEYGHDMDVRASDGVIVVAFRPLQSGTIKLAFCDRPDDVIFADDFDS